MNTGILRTLAAITLGVVLVVTANAQGKSKATPPAKGLACPVCHMPLSPKKDKAHPVAVQFNKGGKVMYCCPRCKMPASMIVKPKSAKHDWKKGDKHKRHSHEKGHRHTDEGGHDEHHGKKGHGKGNG